MSSQGIQTEKMGRSQALAFACSLCKCEGYDLGISSPTVIVPDTRISVGEYLSIHHAPCSFDQIEKYWSDYAIEPECLFDFLRSQSEAFDSGVGNGHWAGANGNVPVSDETSSELAVRVGKQLLRAHPDAAAKTMGVIFYSATLSSRPAWSTSCRLHFELGLKCDTAFMISQKGANASYAALRVAAEMLHIEQLDKILLIGSEIFAPPQSRIFSGFSVQGDSASALLLERREYAFKLCCIGLYDFAKQPPGTANSTHDELLDYWTGATVSALMHLLEASGVRREKLAFVIPPGCSPELLYRIADELRIPREKFDCSASREVGSLGSSDLVLNLDRMIKSGVLSLGDEIISFGFSSHGSVCGCVLRYEERGGVR